MAFYKERTIQGRQKRKAPKGNSESPWSLHIRSFWKIHFINPPEEQGQVVRSKGMVSCDGLKIAQNRKSVKRDFGFPFSTIFQTQDRKGPQHLGGDTGLSKFALTCHSPHSDKISEMKSISKPPIPIEIYTICQNLSFDNFRKEALKTQSENFTRMGGRMVRCYGYLGNVSGGKRR